MGASIPFDLLFLISISEWYNEVGPIYMSKTVNSRPFLPRKRHTVPAISLKKKIGERQLQPN
jgi:hypothetical protein